MITDVPDAAELRAAALDLLNLAWDTGLEVFRLLARIEVEAWDEDGSARRNYHRARQPALRNAHVLVHQAQELGIKAAIADVSPYLLLAAEPRLWPKLDADSNISFLEMRTIDASDLVRVHNAVCAARLSDDFVHKFEAGRRTRNQIVHLGGGGVAADAKVLLLLILSSVEALFSPASWVKLRYAAAFDASEAVVGVDYVDMGLLADFALLQDILDPRHLRQHFGYDKRKRGYVCLNCSAEQRDHGEPSRFAQLVTPTGNQLYCPICGETHIVLRAPCSVATCRSDVLWPDDYKAGTCLICCEQDRERHRALIDAWFDAVDANG